MWSMFACSPHIICRHEGVERIFCNNYFVEFCAHNHTLLRAGRAILTAQPRGPLAANVDSISTVREAARIRGNQWPPMDSQRTRCPHPRRATTARLHLSRVLKHAFVPIRTFPSSILTARLLNRMRWRFAFPAPFSTGSRRGL